MRQHVQQLQPQNAAAIIKRAEQLYLDAYLCPAGIPTIGYGTTKGVTLGQHITAEQADAFLAADITEAVSYVRRVHVPLEQHEFDALVSFVHNIRKSKWNEFDCTLLRRLNAGDYLRAAAEFQRWNKGKDPKTGQITVLNGLTKRRKAEQSLFRGEGIEVALLQFN